MVAIPSREALSRAVHITRRETPKIGGSSAAFVVIVVILVLVIIIACVAIAVLLREEAREIPQPSQTGWRAWVANLFSTQPSEPSSPVDRRVSAVSQKGQGWLQAGQEGDWESRYLKVTPGVSPNSTIASRAQSPGDPAQDPHSILPGNLFGFAASMLDRPSCDITSEPSGSSTPVEGDPCTSHVSPSSGAVIQPSTFETFIPGTRSLSASPSLSTMATHYTHAGSEAIVTTVPPSTSGHESDYGPVARRIARGSKFIESL